MYRLDQIEGEQAFHAFPEKTVSHPMLESS
jgi:hypothetical protein